MSEPVEWPSAPPVEGALPPPPPDGRAVAPVVTRIGELALEVVLVVCTLGFGWVGWWIIAWADGQTPAKYVLHLHAVRAGDGRVATFGQMAVREAIGKAPAGVALAAGIYVRTVWLVVLAGAYVLAGAAIALIDSRRRTLWDRIAGTVVVEGEPPRPLAPTPAEEISLPAVGGSAPA
jgi:uncharacterized RDD family membrane protein YckC